MSIGDRIKEEREKLGYSQEAFANAGGVSKRSQIMYEQNKTEVGAGYFSKIVEIGADIQYILTGKKIEDNQLQEDQIDNLDKITTMINVLNDDQKKEVLLVIKEKIRLNELEVLIKEKLKQ